MLEIARVVGMLSGRIMQCAVCTQENCCAVLDSLTHELDIDNVKVDGTQGITSITSSGTRHRPFTFRNCFRMQTKVFTCEETSVLQRRPRWRTNFEASRTKGKAETHPHQAAPVASPVERQALASLAATLAGAPRADTCTPRDGC